jgi:hypothetical protein
VATDSEDAGLFCGTFFVVNVLAIWPFELTWQVLWPCDAAESQQECSGLDLVEPKRVEEV